MAEEAENEYERKRLETIRRNKEILAKLAVPKLSQIPVKEIKKDVPKKRRNTENNDQIERRTSRRLMEKPPEISVESPIIEQEDIEESRTALQGMLNLSETSVKEMDEDTIRELSKSLKNKTIDYSQFNMKRTIESNLNVDENHIAKVTPHRVYSLEFHAGNSPIIFSGDKEGHIGIFDVYRYADQQVENTNYTGITALRPHRDSVSCLKLNPANNMQLFSCSYDGSIRSFDIEKSVFDPVLIDRDCLFHRLDVRKEDPFVWYFSTSDGHIGHLDTRDGDKSLKKYQLHAKKIGCISLHPFNSTVFITSSLDTTAKIWDIRRIQQHNGDELPEPIRTFENKRALTSAFYCPNNGNKIVTTCYDDTIRLYENEELQVAIKHNTQTGRWITPFRAIWTPESQLFLVGNMKRSLDVYSGLDGALIHQLRAEVLTAQPAVNSVHHSFQWIASGTGSGKVCLWTEE
jgi:WD40 repeat protein